MSKAFGLTIDERLLKYHLGNSHPMNSNRIFPAYHLFNELFLDLDPSSFKIVTPSEIDPELLAMAHDIKYISKINELSKDGAGSAIEYGLGTSDCPVFKDMAETSEFVVSSTVTNAEKIYNEEFHYSFVLLGGLHHARRSRASGFCYYNDVNVAIHKLKQMKDDIKILYFDSDLHFGDGVYYDFENDPNVLKISFHESGHFLFPGTGFPQEIGVNEGEGMGINQPFFPFTWDEPYIKRFDDIIPPLFESFNPDFVIWQAGVDGHALDPLGHLQLTTNTYHHMAEKIRELADKNMDTPKVLSLGGGGYNSDSVARSWASIVSGLSKIKLPLKASEEWVNICESQDISVNIDLHDPMITSKSFEDIADIEKGNNLYFEQFDSIVSKYHSI